MTIPARLWTAAAVLFLLPLALWLAARPLDARLGLSARYYPTADWQGQAVTRIDPEITTRSLRPPAAVARDGAFSARWDGYLHVDRSGPHLFQLVSDDGAWLEIDGKVVIDNGGRHSPILKQETVHLTAGLHVIGLTHFQGAGGWRLDLLSAPEGQRPQPLAAPQLMNRPIDGLGLHRRVGTPFDSAVSSAALVGQHPACRRSRSPVLYCRYLRSPTRSSDRGLRAVLAAEPRRSMPSASGGASAGAGRPTKYCRAMSSRRSIAGFQTAGPGRIHRSTTTSSAWLTRRFSRRSRCGKRASRFRCI